MEKTSPHSDIAGGKMAGYELNNSTPPDLQVLDLYLDFEILKLLYQMQCDESLDINVVSQSTDTHRPVTEIQAAKWKCKTDREVTHLAIKGENILRLHEGQRFRCFLGPSDEMESELCSGTVRESMDLLDKFKSKKGDLRSRRVEKGTQTLLNLKDIESMQCTLLAEPGNKRRKFHSEEADKIKPENITNIEAVEIDLLKSLKDSEQTKEVPSVDSSEPIQNESDVADTKAVESENSVVQEHVSETHDGETVNEEAPVSMSDIPTAVTKSGSAGAQLSVSGELEPAKSESISVDRPMRKRGRPCKFRDNIVIKKESTDSVAERTSPINDDNKVTHSVVEGDVEIRVTSRSGRRIKKPFILRKVKMVPKESVKPKEEVVESSAEVDKLQIDDVAAVNDHSVSDAEKSSVVTEKRTGKDRKKIKKGSSGQRQCAVCGKFVSNMTTHLQSHLSEPHKCPQCDKVFTQMQNVRRHIATIHNKIYPFTCDECGRGFSWKKWLLEHKEVVHKKGQPDQRTFFPRIYDCKECGLAFKNPANLSSHIDAVHKKLRSHQCDICHKKFAKKYHLNVHRRTHSGEKPYLCSFCGKGMADKGNMDAHIRTVHLGVVLYKCDICGMDFQRKKQLKAHQENGHFGSGQAKPALRNVRLPRKRKVKSSSEKQEVCIVHLPVSGGAENVQQVQSLLTAEGQQTISVSEEIHPDILESLRRTLGEIKQEPGVSELVLHENLSGIVNNSVSSDTKEIIVCHMLEPGQTSLPTPLPNALLKNLNIPTSETASNQMSSAILPNSQILQLTQNQTVSTVNEGLLNLAQGSLSATNVLQHKVEGSELPYIIIQGEGGDITVVQALPNELSTLEAIQKDLKNN